MTGNDMRIKPCPFCGGEGRLVKEYESGHGYCIDEHVVRCRECGAYGGRTSTYGNDKPAEELKKEAIDMWNTRKDEHENQEN